MKYCSLIMRNLKHSLIVLLLSGVLILSAAAQGGDGKVKSFRLGVYGTGEYFFGEYADYVKLESGVGVACSYLLPNKTGRCMLGLSVRCEGNVFLPVKAQLGGRNIAALGGILLFIPFGSSGFSIVPELNYGVVFQNIVASNAGSSLDSTYSDNLMVLTLAMRYAPDDLPSVEFEVAPAYLFSPVNDGMIQAASVRVGVWKQY